VKRDCVFRAVWTQDAEHFTFLESTLRKVVGSDTDRVGQLLVRDLASGWTIDQCWFARQLFGSMHDERRKRSLRDGYVWIWSFDNHASGRYLSRKITPLKRE
jgi:hypothetical protein